MKAAIWGCGNIANTHAEAIKAMGVQIAAVVDVNADAAAAFAARWGAAAHGTDKELLFAGDIDIVHVCTPPNLHFDMVTELLMRKKHVLCEKPLCFENAQADELAALAKQQGCICAINFNVRFHMACQKARQVVEAEDFGPVMLVHGNYLQEFGAFPVPLDWRFNPVLAGRMRAVTEIGSHWADIAQYISGRKIMAVSALFGRYNPVRILDERMMYPLGSHEGGEEFNVISEDTACVNLKFDDGAIGTVTLSLISEGRINRITLEVTGENKNLWWNSEDNNMLHTATKGGGVHTDVFGFGNGFADTFRTLAGHYYAAVEAGKLPARPVYPDFTDGAAIVRICNAMLQSADADGAWTPVS